MIQATNLTSITTHCDSMDYWPQAAGWPAPPAARLIGKIVFGHDRLAVAVPIRRVSRRDPQDA